MKSSTHLLISRLLTQALKRKATDIHLAIGSQPVFRIDDALMDIREEPVVSADFLKDFISLLFNENQREDLEKKKSVRTVYGMEDKMRFRAHVFYEKGALSLSLKPIPTRVPRLSDLGIDKNFQKIAFFHDGLVIISGPYGSGRTTVLAALLEEKNAHQSVTMVTFEDPIEYVFSRQKSVIQQRQIGRDVNSFLEGVKQCRGEDFDVIALDGDIDSETTRQLLEIASSGALVFLVMNSLSVIQSLDDALSAFPESQRNRGRNLLAQHLMSAVSLRLLPRLEGGMVLAYETLFANSFVRTNIRDNKIQQLISIMQSSREEGMTTLDQELYQLVSQGVISPEMGLREASDKNTFSSKIRRY